MKKEPPGKIKIKSSLRNLLEEKDFDSITTSEIASNAGVTEGLIYKYFKDKQDLLYELVAEMFESVNIFIKGEVEKEKDVFSKLESFIYSSIKTYADQRVFAKIILIEVRSMPTFFKSRPYEFVKEYSRFLFEIIDSGIKDGLLKQEIEPKTIRDIILGSIEHTCLWGLIFSKNIDARHTTSQILLNILNGVKA